MKNTEYRTQWRRAPLRCLCMVLCILFAGLPAMDAVGVTARAEETTCTVEFDAKNGKAVTSKSVDYNTPVSAPTKPTRTNYKFAAWYTDEEYTQEWDFTTPVTGDMTLYARWTAAVTFSGNGGKFDGKLTTKTVDIYENTEIAGQAPVIDREGYTFTGWYKENTCENKWDLDNDIVTGKMTIYAGWQINSYTVTIDPKNGTDATSQILDYNQTIEAQEDPVKDGFTFSGWWYKVSTDGTTEEKKWTFGSSGTKVADNVTIYAKWQTSVTFDYNGGTYSNQTSKTITVYEGEVIPAGSVPKPTWSNYSLEGWYTDAECTNENEWDLANAKITGAVTLYAKWTPTKYYTVKFDTQDGEPVPPDQVLSYQQKAKRPETDPTKEGHVFVGWFTSSTGSTVYNFDTLVTANKTIYAKWDVIKYTITFDSMGGSAVESKQVEYGKAITSEPKSEREGYALDGWYYKDADENEIKWVFSSNSSATKVTGGVELYAKWKAIDYTITFSPNGGKFDGSTSTRTGIFAYDSKIIIDSEKIPNPTRDGYAFTKKWYTDKECTAEWDFEVGTVKGNMTLYAGWTPIDYDVIFDTQGGTQIAKLSLPFGSKIPRPNDPTKTGYTFKGWYTSSTGSTTWSFDTKTVPVNGVTIYAKWTVNKYTVTFDSMGGSNVSSKTVEYDKTVTAPTKPTRTGYTFDGWWYTVQTDEGETQEKQWVFGTDGTKVTGDITLYAKWTINGYTVTFYSNGDIFSEVGVEHGKKVAQPDDPTNGDKTFVGWVTSSGGSTLFDFNEPITKNTKVYAKWPTSTSQKIYIVNFSKNGHGTTTSKSGLEIGQLLDKPTDPTATGYTFVGWYKEPDCKNAWNFDTDTVQGSQILYAKWTVNTYQVSFDPKGGSAVDPQTVEYNLKAAVPDDPVKEGYTFGGWYKEEACTTPWNFDTDVVTENTTLYAKWTEVVVIPEKYTVTFNMNGHGSDIVSLKDVESGSKITVPTAPTADGWTFEGWYKEEACENAWSFGTDIVTGDTTLYAKWTAVVVEPEKYTVSFNMNGHGSDIVSLKDVESGSKITAPTAPTADGWTFEGWYKDEACENAWSFESDVVTKNTTLYAKWTEVVVVPEKYTVTFNMKGHGSDIADLEIVSGSKITAPTAPTADGWTFEGWYKDEACENAWSFETDIVTGDTTLYAKWTEVVVIPEKYTVTFNMNGHGSDITDLEIVSGSRITAPTAPTADGWTFEGWYKEEACKNAWSFETDIVTEDTTLYAKWTAVVVEPEKYTVSFNMNGHGSAIADLENVVSGSRITAPTAPTADGWTFEGWYKDEACENAWNFDTDAVTEDTTLYAKWTKVEEGDHEVIVGNDTPQVDVGGLDSVVGEAKDEHPGATNVKITMTVEKKEETELPPAAQEIKKEAPSSATLEYLDIGIEKDVDGTKNAINSTSTVIEVKIKFDFSGKTEVNIYREHDGIITRFTENDSKIDSTFILDKTNGFIHIFTQKFSVYAISYKKESTSGGGSTGGSGGGSTGPVSYTITASAGEGGSISPSGSIRVVSYRSLTLTITPEKGYQIADVLVDGKSVGPLSSYTFSNVLAAHSIHAAFEPVETPTPPDPGCPKDESCPAWSYMDVNLNAWYHDGIHYCLEAGLMNGYASDRFGPGDSLTRAQLTQILYNLAGKPLASGPSGFKDVPSTAWYAGAVAWAREAGVVSGYSDTRFAPGDLITREQLAAMIWRYAGSPEAPELALDFKDADEISGYAGSALRWAVAKGIVSGNNGRLEPGKPADRAEAASMIMRFRTEN